MLEFLWIWHLTNSSSFPLCVMCPVHPCLCEVTRPVGVNGGARGPRSESWGSSQIPTFHISDITKTKRARIVTPAAPGESVEIYSASLFITFFLFLDKDSFNNWSFSIFLSALSPIVTSDLAVNPVWVTAGQRGVP